MTGDAASIRLDKWLWQARFCKSRAIATRLITEGVVRVNGNRVTKPAALVRIGDGVSFALGGRVRAVGVLALGTRRGPAPEARTLYADHDEPATPATLEPEPQAGT